MATRTIAALPNARFEPIATNARVGIIDFQRLRASEVKDPFSRAEVFRMATLAILAIFPRARITPLGHEPHDSKIAAALADVDDVDALAITTRDATDNPNQVDVALRAISRIRPGARVIHVALRGPYDAGLLGPVDTTLTTFGDPAVTFAGSAKNTGGILATNRIVSHDFLIPSSTDIDDSQAISDSALCENCKADNCIQR